MIIPYKEALFASACKTAPCVSYSSGPLPWDPRSPLTWLCRRAWQWRHSWWVKPSSADPGSALFSGYIILTVTTTYHKDGMQLFNKHSVNLGYFQILAFDSPVPCSKSEPRKEWSHGSGDVPNPCPSPCPWWPTGNPLTASCPGSAHHQFQRPFSRQAGTLQGSLSVSHTHMGGVSAWHLHKGWLPRMDLPILSSSLCPQNTGARRGKPGCQWQGHGRPRKCIVNLRRLCKATRMVVPAAVLGAHLFQLVCLESAGTLPHWSTQYIRLGQVSLCGVGGESQNFFTSLALLPLQLAFQNRPLFKF